jgi:hypothetical protein
MGMDFHATVMGHRFFEHQLPTLIEALEGLTSELKRHNDLKERELAQCVGNAPKGAEQP